MIELGQHKELAEALKKKRGNRAKVHVAKEIGISVTTLDKLENQKGNTHAISQYLARYWVNLGIPKHPKPRVQPVRNECLNSSL